MMGHFIRKFYLFLMYICYCLAHSKASHFKSSKIILIFIMNTLTNSLKVVMRNYIFNIFAFFSYLTCESMHLTFCHGYSFIVNHLLGVSRISQPRLEQQKEKNTGKNWQAIYHAYIILFLCFKPFQRIEENGQRARALQ